MAGTCKEFGFHFAQSRAPPGRDLELSKLRPREPSRVRTPHAVGGWAPGLCVLGHVLSSEPVLASHASRCGLVCQACHWAARHGGTGRLPSEDPGEDEAACWAGRRPAVVTMPRERPRPSKRIKISHVPRIFQLIKSPKVPGRVCLKGPPGLMSHGLVSRATRGHPTVASGGDPAPPTPRVAVCCSL